MKKLTMIAVFALLLFGFGQMASANVSILPKVDKPSCEEGYVFKGELVKKKVCENPKPWDSIKPRNCKIILVWEGECVKDGDIISTTTPPTIIPGYGLVGDGLVAVLNQQCKDDQIMWSEWSKCDYRFGNGKQFRFPLRDKYDGSRSAFNGCFITGLQQSTWERNCD